LLQRNPIGLYLYCFMAGPALAYSVYCTKQVYVPGPYVSSWNYPILYYFAAVGWASFFWVITKKPLTVKEMNARVNKRGS